MIALFIALGLGVFWMYHRKLARNHTSDLPPDGMVADYPSAQDVANMTGQRTWFRVGDHWQAVDPAGRK